MRAPIVSRHVRSHDGFTLFEILLVVAIIGMLAAIALPTYQDSTSQKKLSAPLSVVDRALLALQWQHMAFVAPEEMELGSTGQVQMVLGGGKSLDELQAMLEAPGNRDGQRVQVSHRMEAALSGPGFNITPITPLAQVVSNLQVTEWKWDIKAVELGKPRLSLSLNAFLTIDGKDSQKSVRTYQKEIAVRVSTLKGAWAFVDSYRAYLGGLFTVVVIPLVVHAYRRRKATPANP